MTGPVAIDAADRRILMILQDNAALTIQEIADRAAMSSNACWRRIKRLEADGILTRKVALIDGAAIGLGLTAFVTIRTSTHDHKWLEGFARSIQLIPEIVECHRMTGDIDYLLKVVVADIEHYDRVYRKLIGVAPSLADVSSTFSMERLKASTALDLATLG